LSERRITREHLPGSSVAFSVHFIPRCLRRDRADRQPGCFGGVFQFPAGHVPSALGHVRQRDTELERYQPPF